MAKVDLGVQLNIAKSSLQLIIEMLEEALKQDPLEVGCIYIHVCA